MINGIIIISPEGEETKVEVLEGGTHKIPLMKYLEKKELTYEGYKDNTSYEISIYLAYLNYLVINIENNRYLYFLGNAITKEQDTWFMNNKRKLRKYKTHIANIEEKEIKFYDEEELNEDGIKGFTMLKDIMAEKIIIDNKCKENIL